MFDLNHAIADWREGMLALQREDVDELESHLRDSTKSLEALGLSAFEAFWLAKQRLGSNDKLETEFRKVNRERVWLQRALWMVVGTLLTTALSSFASLAVTIITIAMLALDTTSGFAGPAGPVIYAGAFFGLLVFGLRLADGKSNIVSKIAIWMQAHRVTAGLSTIAMLVALNAANGAATVLTVNMISLATYGELVQWRSLTAVVPIIIFPLALAILLGRISRATPLLSSRSV